MKNRGKKTSTKGSMKIYSVNIGPLFPDRLIFQKTCVPFLMGGKREKPDKKTIQQEQRINSIVIPLNSNAPSSWTRMCHVPGIKTQQTSLENDILNFRLACDKVVLHELNRGKSVSQPAPSKWYLRFIFYFWVGTCNKTLNGWSRGKQWVLFTLDFNIEGLGETKLTVSPEASH